ncbi:hypothetical protein GCM10009117_08900 [Gangjinia marincola]|uniref:DUF72 domain-containing protein n=1 Tax=Gangjinia marincola TaxID=578463 RepID=A0ABP3XR39_9FLAO
MKFGKVDHPEELNLSLPLDHPETEAVLARATAKELSVYVGCAKWNRQDLKGFYPRGTKDELTYYASQFNAIEMNATFYRLFPKEQFKTWREKVPEGFKFFPKITQNISHLKRLLDPEPLIDEYLDHTLILKEKLGTIFLQMHNNFMPKNFDRVENFLNHWPDHVALAVEFRHTDWFNDDVVSHKLYHLLEQNNVANVLVDTAGRRDIMHMRLTNDEAFIRYVGANHSSDYDRLDEWVDRLLLWRKQGLNHIHFFIHQNIEKESPLLSAYFIKKLKEQLGVELRVPQTLTDQAKLL